MLFYPGGSWAVLVYIPWECAWIATLGQGYRTERKQEKMLSAAFVIYPSHEVPSLRVEMGNAVHLTSEEKKYLTFRCGISFSEGISLASIQVPKHSLTHLIHIPGSSWGLEQSPGTAHEGGTRGCSPWLRTALCQGGRLGTAPTSATRELC